ncbi:aromatic compound dioxygenase [Pleomassaria siparia CBS 279.74]|uniref:Aromatic compound dioxygenase n=1 Tax=Pleomassaria siparia CBS 279.74 TaxID=1314801 RepID=A0A6G1K787_9PLEO|nr:aromatic compound dioxygenase [Pleomassaria siparia CBS 279.74]
MQFLAKMTVVGLATLTMAHPGEHHQHNEVAELSKREFRAATRRGLVACADKLQARDGIVERAGIRRAAMVAKHRQARGLEVRDADTVLNTSHLSTLGYTIDTPESTIFASNKTCILSPEGEIGPYWVKGELLRTDVRDGEPGVPLVVEGQFIDVETCEPITDVHWDLWNCNSTGVYSGVAVAGNGNGDDLTNMEKAFLRGVQKADDEGVVTFETVFPGHYAGRATHQHMVAHLDATVLANKTLSGGTVGHVAQMFWDQDLISAVEATYPYNTSEIDITPNSVDHVFVAETTDTDSDPVFEYVYMGSDISDGIFGWATFAINKSASYDAAYSFVWTDSGSVAETGSE